MAALPREEALSAERIASLEGARPRTDPPTARNAFPTAESARAADQGLSAGITSEARSNVRGDAANAQDRPAAKAPPPSVVGEEEPGWPSAEAEAAFLGEAAGNGDVIAPAADPEADDDDLDGGTPPLASLVEEIPALVRESLEDLFRAKYSRVMRVRKKDLL